MTDERLAEIRRLRADTKGGDTTKAVFALSEIVANCGTIVDELLETVDSLRRENSDLTENNRHLRSALVKAEEASAP